MNVKKIIKSKYPLNIGHIKTQNLNTNKDCFDLKKTCVWKKVDGEPHVTIAFALKFLVVVQCYRK